MAVPTAIANHRTTRSEPRMRLAESCNRRHGAANRAFTSVRSAYWTSLSSLLCASPLHDGVELLLGPLFGVKIRAQRPTPLGALLTAVPVDCQHFTRRSANLFPVSNSSPVAYDRKRRCSSPFGIRCVLSNDLPPVRARIARAMTNQRRAGFTAVPRCTATWCLCAKVSNRLIYRRRGISFLGPNRGGSETSEARIRENAPRTIGPPKKIVTTALSVKSPPRHLQKSSLTCQGKPHDHYHRAP